MLLPGHIAAGYLATKTILSFASPELSAAQTSLLTLIGTLAGAAPDLDLAFYFFSFRSFELRLDKSHREYISHAPLLYFFVALLVALIGGTPFAYALGAVFLGGAVSHFALDTIAGHIMWLWPFSRKRYGLVRWDEHLFEMRGENTLAYYSRLFTDVYLKHPVFWLELALVASALLVLLR